MALSREFRYRWLRLPATTFIITRSPSRSNHRDGLGFYAEPTIAKVIMSAPLIRFGTGCTRSDGNVWEIKSSKSEFERQDQNGQYEM
jgi:hypothetical protein